MGGSENLSPEEWTEGLEVIALALPSNRVVSLDFLQLFYSSCEMYAVENIRILHVFYRSRRTQDCNTRPFFHPWPNTVSGEELPWFADRQRKLAGLFFQRIRGGGTRAEG